MPAPDERMMTTDPTPSSPGWRPGRQGRYPSVKIQKGWEPRSRVGAGQSVGVGGLGYPGQSGPPYISSGLGEPISPWLDPGQNSSTGSPAIRPPDYFPASGAPPPNYFPGNPPTSRGVPDDYSGAPTAPGTAPTGSRTGAPPRGGGGAPAGRVGGQAPRGGGGGGDGGGPTSAEMQQIAQYAASQWGVDPQAALQELMAGAPEAAAYLRAALGMLRAGQMSAGGGAPPAQENLMQITGAAANPPSAPSAAPDAGYNYQPPRTDMHGVSGGIPGAGGTPPGGRWGSDEDYKKGVKANPVLHAAIQYGQMANAEAGPNGLTLVTYTDGNRRWFHPDGKQVHPDELMGLMSPGMTQGLDPSVMSQGVSGDKWNPAGAPGAGTTR